MASEFVVGAKIDPTGITEGAAAARPAVDELAGSVGVVDAQLRAAAGSADRLTEANRRQASGAEAVLASYRAQTVALVAQAKAAQESLAALAAVRAAQAGSAAISAGVASGGVPRESTAGQNIAAQISLNQQLQRQIEQTMAAQAAADRVAANVAGIQARTRALFEEVQAEVLDAAQARELARAREIAAAIRDSGAAPGSTDAAAVEREVGAQRALQAALQAIAAARERDAASVAQEEAAQRRLVGTLTQLRTATLSASEMSAAGRGGAAQVTALNQQLALRNQLIAAGVALYDAEGRFVVINQQGAAAIQEQVAALRLEEEELARVRKAYAGSFGEATGLARGFGVVLGEILQALKFIVVYGGLFAVITALKDAVVESVSFESSLVRLRTLAGASADEVERIRGAVKSIALETGQSADENAKAAFAIESAGLRGKAALDALRESAEGAALGLGDQTTVARTAVAAMTAYGAQNLSTAAALDVVIATAREGNTSIDNIAGSFGRVTGIAAAVGVSFADLGGAIATVTRTGLSADEAVTGLRGTLSALELKNAKGAEAALKTVGLSIAQLRDIIKNQGLAQALVELVSRFDGNNDELAKVIPNIRTLAEVLNNAKSQAKDYVAIQDRVNASIGHAREEAYALLAADPAHVFAEMKESIAEAARELVAGLLPQLVAFAQTVREAVKSGDLGGMAQAMSVGLGILLFALKAVGVVLANAPMLFGAWIVWNVAAGTATTAFGNIVAWCTLRLEAMALAIMNNPWGAAAVGVLVLVAALNNLALAQRAVDQAFLDDVAMANQASLAMAEAAKQYDVVTAAKKRLSGVAAQAARVGAGEVVLSTSANAYLGQLAKIDEAYKQQVVGANGNKIAIDAAKIARDRDVGALEAHTRELIANTKAAIANNEATLGVQNSQLVAAREELQSARTRAAGAGINLAKPTDFQQANLGPYIAAATQAQTKVISLSNSIKELTNGTEKSKTWIDLATKALDRSQAAQMQHTTATVAGTHAQENARFEVEKAIHLKEVELADAAKVAATQTLGSAAVREATIVAQQNRMVEEERAKLAKQKLELYPQDIARIQAVVRGLSDEALEGQRGAAVYAQQLTLWQAAREGRTKLADATSGNTVASQLAAAASQAEAQALQLEYGAMVAGVLVLGERGQKLVADTVALAANRIEIDNRARSIQQAYQATVDQRKAEADLADALANSTTNSRALEIQLEIESRARAVNANSITQIAIALAVVSEHSDLDSMRDRTKQALALTASYHDMAAAQASFADSQQLRSATKAYGTDVANILQKYGLLSRATHDLAIAEQARAIFNEEHGKRSLADITAQLELRERARQAEAQGAADIEIAQLAAAKFNQNLAESLGLLSTAFGGADTELGRMAAALGGVVTALEKVKAAGKTFSNEWANAMAGAVLAVGALIKELNIGGSQKTGGVSALGGRMDSNYAGIGAIAGTMIGGIIAAIYSGGSATGGGAALGGAIGTVIGAMISKAGDSASGKLEAGGLISFGEVSAQLSGAVKDALTGIFKGVSHELAALGLQLDKLPLIDIKIRDNIVRVIVGNVVRTFGNLQDAMSFGIAEAIKQSATSGAKLPSEVLAALAHTTATSLEALKDDIAFAMSIANYGVPQVVQAIDKVISDFFVAMQRAAELGISSVNLVAKFKDDILAQKNALLGIDAGKSPQEKLRDDVAAFNQRMLMMRAEKLADQADLLTKKSDLEIKIAILRAQTSMLGLQAQALSQLETALAATSLALANTQALLDGIVTITDDELAAALARLGRGGSSSAQSNADQRAQIRRQAAAFGVEGVGADILGINEQLRTFIASLKGVGFTAAEVARLTALANAEAARQLAALRDKTIKSARDFINAGTARGGSLLSGMSDVQTTADGLTHDLQALAAAGQIAQWRFRALAEQIANAARAQQIAMVNSAGNDLLGQLYQLLGMDVEAAQLKFDLTVAELQIKRAELAIAIAQLGMSTTILTTIDDLIGRVIAAGPSLFMPHTPANDNFNYADAVAADRRMVNGGVDPQQAIDDALAKLSQYEDLGLSQLSIQIRTVNEDFAKIRLALGDTERVQHAYALAIHDIISKALEPIRQMVDGLNTSTLSPLRAMERMRSAQAQLDAALAALAGGDLNQLATIANLAQNYLQQAQAAIPQGSQAYAAIFANVQALLQGILTQYGGTNPIPGLTTPGAPAIPGLPGAGAPTGGTDVAPVVSAIESGNGEILAELRGIRTNTRDTVGAVDRVLYRLGQTLTVFEQVA